MIPERQNLTPFTNFIPFYNFIVNKNVRLFDGFNWFGGFLIRRQNRKENYVKKYSIKYEKNLKS